MPEIDRDLFHLLSLALLGLIALLTLAVWSSLAGIRKALKKQAEATEQLASAGGGAGLASPATAEPPGDVEEPVEEAATAEAQPEPIPEPIPEPSPGASLIGDRETPGEPEIVPEPTTTPQGAPSDEPVAAPGAGPGEPVQWDREEERFAAQYGGAAATSSAEGPEDPFAVQPAGAAAGDNPLLRDEPAPQPTSSIPEDEPFERNGRWFFKRGDEFMAYDESTGEWVDADPSEAEETSAPAQSWTPPVAEPTPQAVDDETARLATTPGPVESGVEEEREQPATSGFWKCPSCGAVNGASAATCRMCFSERP